MNFGKVFVASWREIIDLRKPRNLIYGPAILRYAYVIQRRGKRGEYTFWDESECVESMQAAGFTDVRTALSFAGQAIVVAGRRN